MIVINLYQTTLAAVILVGVVGCLVFKKVLKQAYRQIPGDPHDYHLLGFTVDGQFYFRTVMPRADKCWAVKRALRSSFDV